VNQKIDDNEDIAIRRQSALIGRVYFPKLTYRLAVWRIANMGERDPCLRLLHTFTVNTRIKVGYQGTGRARRLTKEDHGPDSSRVNHGVTH
jgi:hypothetical protein